MWLVLSYFIDGAMFWVASSCENHIIVSSTAKVLLHWCCSSVLLEMKVVLSEKIEFFCCCL